MIRKLSLAAVSFFFIISCGTNKKMLTTNELKKGNYQELKGLFDESNKSLPQPDISPMYPGGIQGLVNDIGRNLKYPEKERWNGIEGTVILKYVVERDGRIKEIEIEKGLSEGLNNEAIRVIKSLKRFYPGFKDGKPVRVQLKQPIKFNLE